MKRKISVEQMFAFHQYLKEEEREPAAIEKYLRDGQAFTICLENHPATKEQVIYKKNNSCQPVTVNGKISALNKFFSFCCWEDCRVKYLICS